LGDLKTTGANFNNIYRAIQNPENHNLCQFLDEQDLKQKEGYEKTEILNVYQLNRSRARIL
jgi:hypothetical protein